ncbi:nuclear pore complex protein DDB_G0274915-like [Ruditapes philippinarum]|uniref:nuclear pore complex protein DDB_G0274915-like n=1 Tax=Ruditapes philippinarum TaxID=129788 RepID=UPI00295C04AA|nr:nuclear pore complex protein DDB_G0274915-like [Ruditapes philippinarum]
MWGNKTAYHASPTNSKLKKNSTVSILPSSPMITRRRQDMNNSINLNGTHSTNGDSSQNVLSGAGPLLSSPFMPQIKRALGLEPKLQHKYGEQRRHSFGIGITPKSPTITAGSLPHVRLNKTRRLSLSERNSSMLNKSSTVKIAPPVIGKVASPSLYHMRCNTSMQEDRNTPDTYAVISALKERRKRSINTFEEHIEPPQQQAKRRRQESQHSNASTSSMPSMPENFPDLTGADFTMRLDTPSLKRPSRPSQEDVEEWNKMNNSKRHQYEGRNNSILSSLSSSQRLIEKSKRKAESSFTEKENNSYVTKSLRTEPPKLTHIDIQYNTDNTVRTPTVSKPSEKSPQVTNGHLVTTSQPDTEKTQLSQKKEESSKPEVRKMPSMKKTASIYSGLSSATNFKKAQYANVVATLDDYDADKEAENQRVKQMLMDLDESFTQKEANKEAVVTSTTSETTVTTTVSTVTSSSVSIVTTSTGPLTLNVSKPASVLSALEKLSKSPVQETGGLPSTSVSTSQPSMTFKPLFGTLSTSSSSGVSGTTVAGSVTTATVTGTQSSLPGGFTFNTPKTTQSTVGLPNQTTATTVSSGFSLGGSQVSTQVPQHTGIGVVFGATTTTAASSLANTGAGSGFNFGSVTTSTAAPSAAGGFSFTGAQSTPSSTPAVTTTTVATGLGFGSVTSSGATQAPGAGISFNTSTAPAPTSSTPAGGFSFSSKPAGSTAAAAGFLFGTTGSSAAPSTGGFSLGGQTAPAVTTVAPSQFGTTTSTSAAPTFNFGGAQNTGTSTAVATGAGFSFGASSNTVQSATSVFGAPTASTVQSPFGAPASTTQTPFGALASTTQSPFGAPASTTQTPFGAPASTTQTPFGASASTTQSPFGAPASTTQTPFGAPVSTTQTPFGAPVSTSQTPFGTSTGNAAAAFSFGLPKTSASASPFSFNAGSTAATAGSTPFQTGQTTGSTQAGTGMFQFGGTAVTTAAAPAFGAPSTQPPAFGTANPATAFGSTGQTPSFGGSSTTPAFGAANQNSVFGATNQTPAFGATSQTPAFGATNQTSVFGATNQTPAFGAANQTPAFGSATPSFGASTNQKPSTPVFGGTANNTSGSVFGTTGSTGTGFAKSHSMPAFVTSQDSTSNPGNKYDQ